MNNSLNWTEKCESSTTVSNEFLFLFKKSEPAWVVLVFFFTLGVSWCVSQRIATGNLSTIFRANLKILFLFFLWHTSTLVSINVRNDLLIFTTTKKRFPTIRQSLQKTQFQVMHAYLLQAEIIFNISRSEHPHLVLWSRPDVTSKKWVQVLLFWLTVLSRYIPATSIAGKLLVDRP